MTNFTVERGGVWNYAIFIISFYPNMIEKLEKLAAAECDRWLSMEYEVQDTFAKEFAAFADTDSAAMESYLREQDVTSFGTLSIAFEAISRYSNHPEIILPAVQKVLDHSYTADEDSLYHLTVLDDLDTIELFERNTGIYMQHMDLLASRLKPENEPGYLIQLLDVFDMAFVIPENVSENQYVRKQWLDKITDLANYHSFLKVKLKAREVIKNSSLQCEVVPLSFGEKVRKLLGVG